MLLFALPHLAAMARSEWHTSQPSIVTCSTGRSETSGEKASEVANLSHSSASLEGAEIPWYTLVVSLTPKGPVVPVGVRARRGGRVVEGGRLENGKAMSLGGSNPSLSATLTNHGKVPERSKGVAC